LLYKFIFFLVAASLRPLNGNEKCVNFEAELMTYSFLIRKIKKLMRIFNFFKRKKQILKTKPELINKETFTRRAKN